MNSVKKHWYALYLRSRYEKKVHRKLQEKHVESFLPLMTEVHVWSDRKKKVDEPLFRGYVFVRTDLREKETILTTDGVIHFVGIRGNPSPIPDVQIDWLRRIVDDGIDVHREKFLEVGERVKVIAGPLLGLEGIVMQNQGVSRVVISLVEIAQSVSVVVQSEFLERIPERPSEDS
jgi:transcription antitermination factor NusG